MLIYPLHNQVPEWIHLICLSTFLRIASLALIELVPALGTLKGIGKTDHQQRIAKHNITVMSLWAPWRFKSSASRLFAKPFVQAQMKKHTSSASLAFVRGIHRWPVDSPHKRPETRKMSPFDDVILTHKSWNVLPVSIIPDGMLYMGYCLSQGSRRSTYPLTRHAQNVHMLLTRSMMDRLDVGAKLRSVNYNHHFIPGCILKWKIVSHGHF